MAGLHLHIPVVYARKSRPVTMPGTVYLTIAPSHTKGNMVELIVSPEYLKPNEKVLIIDDFLASGATIWGWCVSPRLPERRWWALARWWKRLRRRTCGAEFTGGAHRITGQDFQPGQQYHHLYR